MNAPVDLTNCDREPIHIPGSIQAHGVLVACDATMSRVTRCSANVWDRLGFPTSTVLVGADTAEIFGRDVVHDFKNLLATARIGRRPALLFGLALNGRTFDVSIHMAGREAIIEFEAAGASRTEPLNLVRTVISRGMQSSTLAELTADTARLVRAAVGYDRVMVYRFEADGSGQVVNEAKSGHLESFLGQYFPASDIPQQARALYLRNTIRIIMDSDGDRVPVLPEEDETGAPLDMSSAHLRSVSPVHCEYLRNMGVAASMSVSLIIDGELWGMIACHHYAPKHLTMAERAAVEMFGEFLSIQLDLLRQKSRMETTRSARRALDHFLRASSRHESIPDLLASSLPEFTEMIECDGVALVIDGKWTVQGSVPPAAALPELLAHLDERWSGRIWASHELCAGHQPARDYCPQASGLLAIPLSQRPRDYLMFFRKEFEHTLNWAGNPEKTYQIGPLGDRLTPRKSFAIWKEAVRRQSRPWTEADMETAEAIRSALVEVVLRHNEIVAEERGQADIRQRMLNEELNHRVKNILAVIKSLVGQSNSDGRSPDEYLAILRGRIDALAVAHDQVVRGAGGGLIDELLRAELRPYGEHAGAITLDGPPVWADTSAFSVLALVFHELVTNAAKYGALSRPEGRLAVTWSLDRDGNCELVWLERGGPQVQAPSRRGFGSMLIGRSIPHDLGGAARLDYEPEGLRATFTLPAAKLSSVDDAASRSLAPAAVVGGRTFAPIVAADRPILLVEDQMLIAMDAEMMLAEIGLTNVVTVSSTAEALARLATLRPAAAILDVNLGLDTSVTVAEQLRRQGTPFVFATGYGDSSSVPAGLSDVRVIRKPYSSAELAAVMALLLGDGAAETSS